MSKQITVHYENKPCYEILLEQNFDRLLEGLQNVPFQREQKVCIVTDTNLEQYHLCKLKEVLRNSKSFLIIEAELSLQSLIVLKSTEKFMTQRFRFFSAPSFAR